MTIGDTIKRVIAYSGQTQAEIARKTSQSPQTLNKKITRNKIDIEELEKIANATNSNFTYSFQFRDGTIIKG